MHRKIFKLLPINHNLLAIIIYYLLTALAFADTYSLETLNLALMANNPDIRAAEEEYNRSVLDYKDALASIGPKIDLQISGTYMVNPPVGSLYVNADDIINSVQWPGGISPSKTGQYIKIYDGMENTLYSFGLTLEQPVFTWGKIYNARKLYKEISNVQELKLENTRTKYKTELETRIVTLSYLYKIKSILQEEKTYADEIVTFSEEAETNGMLLHQDVVEAKIKAKELDIAEQGVDEQITSQLLELQRITGIQDLTFEEIDYEYDESEKYYNNDEEIRDSFLDAALSGNQITIKMVNKTKEINDIATKIAKDSVYWKPDIGFQASANYGFSRFPFVEKNWTRKNDYTLNLSLGITTTVWDGGKKLNDIARSKSNAESAQINADAARATIRKTLLEQFNTVDVCSMKIEYQDLKIETAESKIKQQETLYESGYGSKPDLLSAKIEKCNAQIEKTQAELQRSVAALTIRFLTDGE